MLEAWFFLSGRLGRLAYLGYSLLLGVILLALGFLLILPARNAPNGGRAVVLIVFVFGLIGIWGGICLGVKRLHDLDMSGWHYAWMALVPGAISGVGSATHAIGVSVVGAVMSLAVWLYLQFWPGTDGPNRYGYPP